MNDEKIITVSPEEPSREPEEPTFEEEGGEGEKTNETTELSELSALVDELPHLCGTAELSETVALPRYRELRALGLTPREAYLATAKPKAEDTRAHLTDSYPRASVSPRSGITQGELTMARELFEGLSDKEIIRLYKKVTK